MTIYLRMDSYWGDSLEGQACFAVPFTRWREGGADKLSYKIFHSRESYVCGRLDPRSLTELKKTWEKVIEFYCDLLPDCVSWSKKTEVVSIKPAKDVPVSLLSWVCHDLRKITEHPGLAKIICDLIDSGVPVDKALSLTYGLYSSAINDNLGRGHVFLHRGESTHHLGYPYNPKKYMEIFQVVRNRGGNVWNEWFHSHLPSKISNHIKKFSIPKSWQPITRENINSFGILLGYHYQAGWCCGTYNDVLDFLLTKAEELQ